MFGSFFHRHQHADNPQIDAAAHHMHSGHHLIDIQNVVKTFDTAAGKFTALKGIDLQVGAGEFVAVVGKSGSGKSTLSNMITGIDRPSEGDVFVDSTPVHMLTEGETAQWRGKSIGVVFQFFSCCQR